MTAQIRAVLCRPATCDWALLTKSSVKDRHIQVVSQTRQLGRARLFAPDLWEHLPEVGWCWMLRGCAREYARLYRLSETPNGPFTKLRLAPALLGFQKMFQDYQEHMRKSRVS